MGLFGMIVSVLALAADFYILGVFLVVMIACHKEMKRRGFLYERRNKKKIDKP